MNHLLNALSIIELTEIQDKLVHDLAVYAVPLSDIEVTQGNIKIISELIQSKLV